MAASTALPTARARRYDTRVKIEAMEITFNCDACEQSIAIDEAAAGQLVDCPKCGTSLEVPYKSKPLEKAATPAPPPDKTASTSSSLPKILTVLVIITLMFGGGFIAYNYWQNQQTVKAEAAVEKAKAEAAAEVEQAKRDFTVDVFIRTKGGESIKCGLVSVLVFDEKTINSWQTQVNKSLQENVTQLQNVLTTTTARLHTPDEHIAKSEDIATARMALNVRIQFANWSETVGGWICDRLPSPQILVKTDADGKCHGQVPKPGKYAFCARFSRLIDEEKEETYWLTWIDIAGKELKAVMLSNDNTLDSNNPDNVFAAWPPIPPPELPKMTLASDAKDLQGFLKQLDELEHKRRISEATGERDWAAEYVGRFIIAGLKNEQPPNF